MELILWRHADAESGIPDEERPLSPKGLKQAQRMAEWLKARLPKDAMMLVSPARRAQETARALTKKFEICVEVGTSATPGAVLQAANWPDADRAVVVVGHQPTLGQVAALALSGNAAEWSIKKGAIWWLERRDRDRETLLRAVISPDLL
jgi:phosphohistidine phosphatase